MTPQAFIDMVSDTVTKAGVNFTITDGKYLISGTKCAGFFDDSQLRVAGKHRGWFPVLVHEFGHFTQWRDNCKPWRDLNDSCEAFDDWTEGKIEFRDKTIDRHFQAVRNMELDCERRSVRLIRKYDLDVDIPSYIQSANAYIYVYAYIRKYRVWPKKNMPHFCKTIWKTLPAVFLNRSQYNVMPEEFENLVNKMCFRKNNAGNIKRVA